MARESNPKRDSSEAGTETTESTGSQKKDSVSDGQSVQNLAMMKRQEVEASSAIFD